MYFFFLERGSVCSVYWYKQEEEEIATGKWRPPDEGSLLEGPGQLLKSPDGFSYHSDEIYVEQDKPGEDNKEVSIRSNDELDSVSEHRHRANGKIRKVSTSSFSLRGKGNRTWGFHLSARSDCGARDDEDPLRIKRDPRGNSYARL
jgi:hypothetical protein